MKLCAKYLDTAMAAADAADAIAMHYFRRTIEVETKADQSPVTRADRQAEQAIRQHLSATFPDHAFYGEEFGRTGDADWLWLIDPIDGTRSFIRGLPFWSVQIALMIEGRLVLGVSSAPAFAERAWAVRGQGAFLARTTGDAKGRPQRLVATPCDTLARADLSLGNLRSLARSPQWPRLAEVVAQAARMRGYGDFYPYHRLAEGALDAVIESDVNILDIAALNVIVEEAGGIFTDLYGQPIGLETTSVLTASPGLHEQMLSFFTR